MPTPARDLSVVSPRPATGPVQQTDRPGRDLVLRTAAGRVAGVVRMMRGIPVFYRSVAPCHFLRLPRPALATELVVLAKAKEHGALLAVVRERVTGRWRAAPLDAFDAVGFDFQRGHGLQRALPLGLWAEGPDRDAVLAAAISDIGRWHGGLRTGQGRVVERPKAEPGSEQLILL